MDSELSTVNEHFFGRLLKAANRTGAGNDVPTRLAEIQSTCGKIDFVIDLFSEFDITPIYLKDLKSNETSSDLRIYGNKLFSNKKDEEALEKYTCCVAVANNESEELGLGYANRSAVLFKLGFYEDCLKDIERAFHNNYPDRLKPKLIDRQKKAESLRSQQKIPPYHQPKPFITEENRNPKIECASKAIEIKSDPKFGRYVIASKDIEIGEILAVEVPSFTILTDKKWCHCHHCLNLCYCLIPCHTCTKALFCSERCKNDAKLYHNVECRLLRTLYSFKLNPCLLLPLRIAIMMTYKYDNLRDSINEPSEIYRSRRYEEIHNLVTNTEQRSALNLAERVTYAAIFYVLVERYTNFFRDNDIASQNTFKTLVLHHLQTTTCNFHSIDDFEENSDGIFELRTIASGAYSFLSLFNHSCAPTVCRRNVGSTIVVSALESMKKGDQLFDNYGFHFATHSKTVRQAGLKSQYFFDCDCRACKHNWAIFGDLPWLSSEVETWKPYYKKLARADLATANEIEDSLKKAARKFQDKAPCKDLCGIQEYFKQCIAINGNIRQPLKQNEES